MGITIGQQIAAIVQFVVIMTLLTPIAGMTLSNGNSVLGATLYTQIYGTNGLLQNTNSTFKTQIITPLITNANSSQGFGATIAQATGAIGFIYGAIGMVWTTFTNFPKMLYIIFTSEFSPLSGVLAVTGIASVGILSYVILCDFFTLLSAWLKTDVLNVGQ